MMVSYPPVESAQYRASSYAQRLEAESAVASVGSLDDSYGNAMAEALNSLFKAELVHNHGPWRGVSDLEVGVADWVDRYNFRRLHEEIGYRTPAEFEAEHKMQQVVEELAVFS